MKTQARVREIELPPGSRALSTLSRIDYADSFLLETGRPEDMTAEQWARAMIEGASPRTRRALRRGWFMLGMRLGPAHSDRLVLGWEVRHSTPDYALLAATSRLGMVGELLFERRPDGLLFATFLQLGNPLARVVWARVAPPHRRVVQHLLARAAR